MPQIADGSTDLVRNLLTNSQDPKGEPIKWKFEEQEGEKGNKEKGARALPDITAEFEGDDGLKRIYSIDMSQAMGRISESVIKPDDYDDKQKERKREMKRKNISDAQAAHGKTVGGPSQTPIEVQQQEREKQEKELEREKEKQERQRDHETKTRR
jgi:hypothetical protein